MLNTGVSFPIAFRKAIIYGAEARLDLPQWRGLSGFASYSYTVGNAWFPVVGGLFLGQDAINDTTQVSGHFPDSQDERNTIRFRMRYDVAPRFWIAGGAQYGSGLPFDFNGTEALALSQYGQRVVDRVNFDRGRVRPSLSIDLSLGAEIYKSDFLGHADSIRRGKSEQSAECDRFWRPVFRKRNRTTAKLFAAPQASF